MSPAAALIAAAPRYQSALLAWFDVHQRRLPWREAPSLYKTVVSEFMLQQTQVKTVLPYFARWIDALPDFAALAAAPEAQVLKLWEGLGYYSRARNLHRLARAYVALPAPPRTPAEWQQLPGIGPYTAAAITSIALGQPAACVDGNVVRILARLTADSTPFRDSAGAAKAFAPLASTLLSPTRPGDQNQATMELGATVCHRQSPLCTICPVLAFCAAARSGDPESFPRLAPKQIEAVSVDRVWCIRDRQLLLHRAGADSRRLAHQHELPTATQAGVAPARLAASALLARKKRAITRFAITESIYRVDPAGVAPSAECIWLPLDQLDTVTLSGPHRRWITALL